MKFRGMGAFLSVVYFMTNCVLAHAVELNIWSLRQAPLLTPSSKPVILHIQDIHLNEEAQQSIRKNLEALVKNKAIDLVAVEGAFDAIDLSRFQNFPRREIVRNVADSMATEQKISGAIHAALTYGSRFPQVTGIDDAAHYEANVQAYLDSNPAAPALKRQWAAGQRQLAQEKKRVFNPLLAALDEVVSGYREGRVGLGRYLQELAAIESRPGSQVQHFLEALSYENTLNFKRVESERNQLLSALTKKLTPKESTQLMRESVDTHAGRLTAAAFYSQLQKLSESKGLDLALYPAMKAYIRYVVLSDEIKAMPLLAEAQQLENELYSQRSRTAAERALIEKSRHGYLVGKLLDFSLTRQEWEEYRDWAPAFAGVTELQPFEEFYRQAEIRDEKMASNLLRALDRKPVKMAALITGGFHAQGIDRRLREAGYEVVSWVPKITKIDIKNGSAYLSVFNREKSPLEKLFAGEKLFLSPKQWSSEVESGAGRRAIAQGARTGVSAAVECTWWFGPLILRNSWPTLREMAAVGTTLAASLLMAAQAPNISMGRKDSSRITQASAKNDEPLAAGNPGPIITADHNALPWIKTLIANYLQSPDQFPELEPLIQMVNKKFPILVRTGGGKDLAARLSEDGQVIEITIGASWHTTESTLNMSMLQFDRMIFSCALAKAAVLAVEGSSPTRQENELLSKAFAGSAIPLWYEYSRDALENAAAMVFLLKQGLEQNVRNFIVWRQWRRLNPGLSSTEWLSYADQYTLDYMGVYRHIYKSAVFESDVEQFERDYADKITDRQRARLRDKVHDFVSGDALKRTRAPHFFVPEFARFHQQIRGVMRGSPALLPRRTLPPPTVGEDHAWPSRPRRLVWMFDWNNPRIFFEKYPKLTLPEALTDLQAQNPIDITHLCKRLGVDVSRYQAWTKGRAIPSPREINILVADHVKADKELYAPSLQAILQVLRVKVLTEREAIYTQKFERNLQSLEYSPQSAFRELLIETRGRKLLGLALFGLGIDSKLLVVDLGISEVTFKKWLEGTVPSAHNKREVLEFIAKQKRFAGFRLCKPHEVIPILEEFWGKPPPFAGPFRVVGMSPSNPFSRWYLSALASSHALIKKIAAPVLAFVGGGLEELVVRALITEASRFALKLLVWLLGDLSPPILLTLTFAGILGYAWFFATKFHSAGVIVNGQLIEKPGAALTAARFHLFGLAAVLGVVHFFLPFEWWANYLILGGLHGLKNILAHWRGGPMAMAATPATGLSETERAKSLEFMKSVLTHGQLGRLDKQLREFAQTPQSRFLQRALENYEWMKDAKVPADFRSEIQRFIVLGRFDVMEALFISLAAYTPASEHPFSSMYVTHVADSLLVGHFRKAALPSLLLPKSDLKVNIFDGSLMHLRNIGNLRAFEDADLPLLSDFAWTLAAKGGVLRIKEATYMRDLLKGGLITRDDFEVLASFGAKAEQKGQDKTIANVKLEGILTLLIRKELKQKDLVELQQLDQAYFQWKDFQDLPLSAEDFLQCLNIAKSLRHAHHVDPTPIFRWGLPSFHMRFKHQPEEFYGILLRFTFLERLVQTSNLERLSAGSRQLLRMLVYKQLSAMPPEEASYEAIESEFHSKIIPMVRILQYSERNFPDMAAQLAWEQKGGTPQEREFSYVECMAANYFSNPSAAAPEDEISGVRSMDKKLAQFEIRFAPAKPTVLKLMLDLALDPDSDFLLQSKGAFLEIKTDVKLRQGEGNAVAMALIGARHARKNIDDPEGEVDERESRDLQGSNGRTKKIYQDGSFLLSRLTSAKKDKTSSGERLNFYASDIYWLSRLLYLVSENRPDFFNNFLIGIQGVLTTLLADREESMFDPSWVTDPSRDSLADIAVPAFLNEIFEGLGLRGNVKAQKKLQRILNHATFNEFSRMPVFQVVEEAYGRPLSTVVYHKENIWERLVHQHTVLLRTANNNRSGQVSYARSKRYLSIGRNELALMPGNPLARRYMSAYHSSNNFIRKVLAPLYAFVGGGIEEAPRLIFTEIFLGLIQLLVYLGGDTLPPPVAAFCIWAGIFIYAVIFATRFHAEGTISSGRMNKLDNPWETSDPARLRLFWVAFVLGAVHYWLPFQWLVNYVVLFALHGAYDVVMHYTGGIMAMSHHSYDPERYLGPKPYEIIGEALLSPDPNVRNANIDEFIAGVDKTLVTPKLARLFKKPGHQADLSRAFENLKRWLEKRKQDEDKIEGSMLILDSSEFAHTLMSELIKQLDTPGLLPVFLREAKFMEGVSIQEEEFEEGLAEVKRYLKDSGTPYRVAFLMRGYFQGNFMFFDSETNTFFVYGRTAGLVNGAAAMADDMARRKGLTIQNFDGHVFGRALLSAWLYSKGFDYQELVKIGLAPETVPEDFPRLKYLMEEARKVAAREKYSRVINGLKPTFANWLLPLTLSAATGWFSFQRWADASESPRKQENSQQNQAKSEDLGRLGLREGFAVETPAATQPAAGTPLPVAPEFDDIRSRTRAAFSAA